MTIELQQAIQLLKSKQRVDSTHVCGPASAINFHRHQALRGEYFVLEQGTYQVG
ncbi:MULTISPECIES: hypothetical protein [unclassified Sporosarcina]|uniref:hypothetical protein n=1 Tax=unclassified Sporosarcina TaxID=2647733 RepID=UPI0013043257